MNDLEQFLWGFIGSVAAEIVTLVQLFESGIPLHGRYKSFGFWVVRFMLTLLAGCLVIVYDIQSRPLAIHIGVTTPLIIRALSQKSPIER